MLLAAFVVRELPLDCPALARSRGGGLHCARHAAGRLEPRSPTALTTDERRSLMPQSAVRHQVRRSAARRRRAPPRLQARADGAWTWCCWGSGPSSAPASSCSPAARRRVNAGPAVALSFVIAGMASVFAGLCYAEMASMIPISGSAYTYSYATMGELVAWIIGWDLILEYLVAAAAVSVGWSGYVVAFVQHAFGVQLPAEWTNAPVTWVTGHEAAGRDFASTGNDHQPAGRADRAGGDRHPGDRHQGIGPLQRRHRGRQGRGGAGVHRLRLPLREHPRTGSRSSPRTQGAFGHVRLSRASCRARPWCSSPTSASTPSAPPPRRPRNPQRDLPIGILGSLAVCTVLYIAVSLILTGVVHYTKLNVPHPISVGIAATGNRLADLRGRDRAPSPA